MMGSMATEERAPAGFGCLSTIIGVVVLAAIVVLVFFVGIVVLGVVAALVVVGLLVFAVDRALLALSPKRRERRAEQQRTFVWRFGQAQSGAVIDTTAIDATAVDTTEDLDDGTSGLREPGQMGPE
jgi:purine-cytosine permease-like protein